MGYGTRPKQWADPTRFHGAFARFFGFPSPLRGPREGPGVRFSSRSRGGGGEPRKKINPRREGKWRGDRPGRLYEGGI